MNRRSEGVAEGGNWVGDFGDVRLNRNGEELLNRLEKKQVVSLRRLGEDRAGEMRFGRFLRNKKVQEGTTIEGAARQTAARSKGRHVLCIEDTSECNVEAHAKRISGFGAVGNGKDAGFFMHPLLAVDAEERACLGLVDLHLWSRTEPAHKDYRRQPIEEKESYRWIQAAEAGKACLRDAALLTIVTDREGDIYEFWSRVPDDRTHLLIRAGQDRALTTREGQSLFAYMDAQPVASSYALNVAQRVDKKGKKKRSAHTALLHVSFGEVTIRRPVYCSDRHAPKELRLYFINVVEDASTVVAGEKPIHWRLLTTHEVRTMAQAKQCIEWYCQRWHIEQLFRTLKKQGLDIESSQIEQETGLRKLCCFAVIAAVKIMQLTIAREGKTHRPAADAFDEREAEVLQQLQPTLEGKTAAQKNPYPLLSLAWAAWTIARLGGWKGYRSERTPGPITMHRGLMRFYSIYEGWRMREAFQDVCIH